MPQQRPTLHILVEDPPRRMQYRWMLWMLVAQFAVTLVSSLTGVLIDYIIAGGVVYLFITLLIGLMFHSYEDSWRMRWGCRTLAVFNTSLIVWMALSSMEVLLTRGAMPFAAGFAVMSTVCLTLGLWLLRQRVKPIVEEEVKKVIDAAKQKE